jgi:hypothetical protein
MPRPTTTTYKRYRKYKGGKTKYYKGKKKTNTKRRTEKRYKKRVDEPMYKYY